MKSAIQYPDPPKTSAEADFLARVLERKFGFVVIGIVANSSTILKPGDYMLDLWGISVEEDYEVKAIGSAEDWDVQTAFLEKYFNRPANPGMDAKNAKQIVRVVRVKD